MFDMRCFDCIVDDVPECTHLENLCRDYIVPEIETDERYTPLKILNAIKGTFGGSITLDVASCEKAQRRVLAKEYYTRQQNGLLMPWYGDIFCNPPYSEGHQKLFILKGLNGYEQGSIRSAIFLLPHTTLFSSFADNFLHYPMCLLKHITFDNAQGEPVKFGNGFIILYLGRDNNRFVENFTHIGRFVIGWRNRGL